METVLHCNDLVAVIASFLTPRTKFLVFARVCRAWREQAGTVCVFDEPTSIPAVLLSDEFTTSWRRVAMAVPPERARCVVVTDAWFQNIRESTWFQSEYQSSMILRLLNALIANPNKHTLHVVLFGDASRILDWFPKITRRLLHSHPRLRVTYAPLRQLETPKPHEAGLRDFVPNRIGPPTMYKWSPMAPRVYYDYESSWASYPGLIKRRRAW